MFGHLLHCLAVLVCLLCVLTSELLFVYESSHCGFVVFCEVKLQLLTLVLLPCSFL